ncbi:MAG: hypothetical protein WBA93_05190 [Microcoleaceae cyanobacterium]
MILFFSPVLNLVAKSEKQAKLVFWGVELVPAPNENKSLQVSGDFHAKLLSFIKYYIDEAIAEMEQNENLSDKELQQKAAEAKQDIFGTEPKPETPYSSPVSKPEIGTNEAIALLLQCRSKHELAAQKAELGDTKVREIWASFSISQKNILHTISLKEKEESPTVTLGYEFGLRQQKGKKARFIGYYLYGEKLKNPDDRAILIKGDAQPTIVDKRSISALKNPTPPTESEIKILQKLLINPAPLEKDDISPTPEEIAKNTFTGLETPKPQACSQSGKQPDSQPSSENEPRKVELLLEYSEAYIPQDIEGIPTPALEAIASEISKINPDLTFQYETTPKATFLYILHDESKIGYFEHEGCSIWESCQNLRFHGFTPEKIDNLAEKAQAIAQSQKS